MEESVERELGEQPLDAIMGELNLQNNDLVRVSTEHLTHKMVRRGRKGRRLTRNVQMKILDAMNALSGEERQFKLQDLFNYR